MIRLFTDGACTDNGKKNPRAAYAYWFPENASWSHADIVPADQTQSNQRAELLAIHEGVKKAIQSTNPAETDLQIYTDSMYSKNCLTQWLPSWLKNNWKTSTGSAVNHRDLIEETSRMLPKFRSYTITHVRAHTGGSDDHSKNNAVVDRMATEVLNPPETPTHVVHVNTEVPIEGLPLALMGPPMTDTQLATWCRTNLDKLDKATLDTALLSALQKTVRIRGFEMEKQRVHRGAVYRLISANHLIGGGGITVEKTE
jgi:ribonuclease HI